MIDFFTVFPEDLGDALENIITHREIWLPDAVCHQIGYNGGDDVCIFVSKWIALVMDAQLDLGSILTIFTEVGDHIADPDHTPLQSTRAQGFDITLLGITLFNNFIILVKGVHGRGLVFCKGLFSAVA